MKVSCCLPAYNEEKNIGQLLDKLTNEKSLDEIVVIASGCTDRTIEIARLYENFETGVTPSVKVLVQKEREGKSSAINLFLRQTDCDIVVMESTDTLPSRFAIPLMLDKFRDPSIGMVSAAPTPVDDPGTRMGRIVSLLWESHNVLAEEHPKMGELVAFRRCFDSIPKTSSVDEAAIENLVTSNGLKLLFVPNAKVYNKGADTVSDFLKQRKRIHLGHIMLKKNGYEVSSFAPSRAARAVLQATPKTLVGILTMLEFALLEAIARTQATLAYSRGEGEYTVWGISESTKELAATD